MRNDIPELRPELWPSGPLPIPTVLAGPLSFLDDVLWAYTETSPDGLQVVSVTDELYLRELPGLDLDDRLAVLDFAQQHGTIHCPLSDLLHALDEQGHYARHAEALHEQEVDMRVAVSDCLTSVMGSAIRAHGKAIATAGTRQGEALLRDLQTMGLPEAASFCHIEEMRRTIALLRDLVRIWAWHQEELSFTRVQTEWESPLRPPDQEWGSWPSKYEALRLLEATLNRGLSDLRPHVTLGLQDERIKPWAQHHVGLFAALCVQFVNHVIEGSKYKTCENCGTWFVRQVGRAHKGQHRRSGVKYCSHHCAKAASERNRYRKRVRGMNATGGAA